MIFHDKILPVLESLKEQSKVLISAVDQDKSDYNEFVKTFEETDSYDLIKHENLSSHKDPVLNPFVDFYMWAKGELYDLAAMREAIAGRDEIIDQIAKLELKKSQYEESVFKLNSGKKTLK